MDPNLEVPVYSQPQTSKKKIVSYIIAVLLLISLPSSLLLLTQTETFKSQADIPSPIVGHTSFYLDKKEQGFLDEGKLKVEVSLHSDFDEANLFYSEINFPKDLLEAELVATPSAQTPKLIKTGFDNLTGKIYLLSSVPKPGLKTSPEEKTVMAEVIFKVKSAGPINLTFDPKSAIYRDADNLNIAEAGGSLETIISVSTPSAVFVKNTPSPSPRVSLTLLEPGGGEVFDYSKQIPIKWSGDNLDKTVINLLLNGERFAVLGVVSSNEFVLTPQKTINLALINILNTFSLMLEGVNKQGEKIQVFEQIPFGITLGGEGGLKLVSKLPDFTKESFDFNNDGEINLTDLSILLSNFGPEPPQVVKADLNGDGFVNNIDLSLFLKHLYSASI